MAEYRQPPLLRVVPDFARSVGWGVPPAGLLVGVIVFGFEAVRGGISSLVVAVSGALSSFSVRGLSGMPFSIGRRLGSMASCPSWGPVPVVSTLV